MKPVGSDVVFVAVAPGNWSPVRRIQVDQLFINGLNMSIVRELAVAQSRRIDFVTPRLRTFCDTIFPVWRNFSCWSKETAGAATCAAARTAARKRTATAARLATARVLRIDFESDWHGGS